MKQKLQFVGVDLDGSLCRGSQRLHLQPPPEKRGDPLAWEPFHMACGGDAIIEDVAVMLRALQRDGILLMFISYRSESCRAITEEWLRRHGFDHGKTPSNLILRPGDRGTPAPEFKLAAIQKYCQDYDAECLFMVEDDLPVCQHLRAHGIPCYQVRDWSNPMPHEKVAMPTYHAADPVAQGVKEIAIHGLDGPRITDRYIKEFVVPLGDEGQPYCKLVVQLEGIGPVPQQGGVGLGEIALDLIAVEEFLEPHYVSTFKALGLQHHEEKAKRRVATLMMQGEMLYPNDSGYGDHDHTRTAVLRIK